MNTYLLAWNPNRWKWVELSQEADQTAAGKIVTGRWSCGNTKKIQKVPGCNFDFETIYGELGKDFAHVHHLKPLADRESPSETSLDDLAVVCTNCHSMIHRGGKCRSLGELIP